MPSPLTADGRNLNDVLRSMDVQASRSDFADQKGRVYNLAGDLCFDAGQRQRALAYYGRAIDQYLAGERYDSAAAVCRKIVRIAPDVVRARCTLAWIAIGKGLFSEASREVAAYATAAERAGRGELALEQLRLMGEIADAELRQAIAETLLNLGDDHGADLLFRRIYGGATEEEVIDDEDARWARVVQAAVTPAGT